MKSIFNEVKIQNAKKRIRKNSKAKKMEVKELSNCLPASSTTTTNKRKNRND